MNKLTIGMKFWLWLGLRYWKGIDVKKDKNGEFIEGITFSDNEKYLKLVSKIEL